ncbi:hypothetical protein Leryth_015228 [Lithospermum erythrorhizon]|nr:hypothetical protein Leryth_015228 [Lithospermum erythrorhizon]
MSHYHQTLFTKQDHHLSLDALYCEEEQWDDLKTEDFFSFEAINHSPPLLMQEDLFWEDEELINMLSKEQENELCSTLLENPSMAKSRHDAIEWMLEVVGEKPWMIQLTAVSCLSLAAKVEETHVPLLLDFQVEECKFVFEAKTIRRMEILVLSTLQWKMNPVTPLSFIDFIIRRLGLMDRLSWEFLNKCERLLLAVISDCRFTVYLPSEMATATMLEVISNLKPSTDFKNNCVHHDKGQVEECCRLIKEVAATIHWNSSSKRRLASLPKSPKGVMDVSFSSESSNESWAVASSSVTSSPHALPPQLKKCRKYV